MDRLFFLDNAKAILIFLVILGHVIEPLISSNETLNSIYFIIYSFHMPLFAILSGMLSVDIFNKRLVFKLVNNLFVPLISFSLIIELLHLFITGQLSPYMQHLHPYWILWFLLSLIIWKLLLPIAAKSKLSIPVSFAAAIAVGYIDEIGYTLGVSRTVYFFPFFLVGYFLRTKLQFITAPNTAVKFAAVGFIAGLITICIQTTNLNPEILYGNLPYELTGVDNWKHGVKRGALIILALITSAAILILTPNRKSIISKVGESSLYIYLLHGIFTKAILGAGIAVGVFLNTNIFSAPTVIACAILLMTILSSKTVTRFIDRLLFKPVRIILMVHKLEKRLIDPRLPPKAEKTAISP